MSIEEQIEQIDISMEHAKTNINMMDALNKLTTNKDFKKVILEGYFKDEASRLVLLKADNSMQGEQEQTTIDKSIIAVGYLRQYFSTIMQIGSMAERALKDDEITREELLTE